MINMSGFAGKLTSCSDMTYVLYTFTFLEYVGNRATYYNDWCAVENVLQKLKKKKIIMEMVNSIIGMPYVFHCIIVSVVLLGAVLLFIFSMKPAEEPNFKIKGDSKPNNKKKKGKENKVSIVIVVTTISRMLALPSTSVWWTSCTISFLNLCFQKIASNGLLNAVDLKSSKSSANTKVRSPKSEDKGKKTNALKESKNVNITSTKNVKKDSTKNENKKKGKENVESNASYSDEEGEQYIFAC